MAVELAKYVKSPIMFMQSLYDGHYIKQILGFECAEEFASLSECTKAEREVIDEHYRNTTRDLSALMALNERSTAFGVACVAH